MKHSVVPCLKRGATFRRHSIWLTDRHPLKFVSRCVSKCSNKWLTWRTSKGDDLSIKQRHDKLQRVPTCQSNSDAGKLLFAFYWCFIGLLDLILIKEDVKGTVGRVEDGQLFENKLLSSVLQVVIHNHEHEAVDWVMIENLNSAVRSGVFEGFSRTPSPPQLYVHL